MRFLCIFTPDPTKPAEPPSPEAEREMGEFVERNRASGVVIATGGMYPVAHGGARLQASGGEVRVLDGPFAESKEVIAGFALIDVKDRDEAIALGRRFLSLAGDGESLVYRVEDNPPGCG
jgi:hypothetical protein